MSSLIRSGLRASGDRRGRTVLLALSSIAAVIVTVVTIRLALAQTDEGQWAVFNADGLSLRISRCREEG
jgi:hypothetical protein